MKVGILGLGAMGSNHLRVLRDVIGIDEVAVFDISPNFVDRKIPGVIKCNTYNEFLDVQNDLDYSVIATPTTLHEGILASFLKESWNVLIEKPVTASLEQGINILKLSASSKSKATVGHIERFNSAIIEGKKKLRDRVVGNVFQILTVRQGPLPIRISDVGVLADLATHDIDLVHFLTEDVYAHVYADMKFRSGREYEDAVMVMGKTQNGISVLHNINWLSPKKERSITIMGDKGTLFIDCLKSELLYHENASVGIEDERLANFRGVSEGNSIQYAFPKREALFSQHLEVMKFIKGENCQVVTLNEAVNTLAVMDSIEKSFSLNERVNVNYV